MSTRVRQKAGFVFCTVQLQACKAKITLLWGILKQQLRPSLEGGGAKLPHQHISAPITCNPEAPAHAQVEQRGFQDGSENMLPIKIGWMTPILQCVVPHMRRHAQANEQGSPPTDSNTFRVDGAK
eukprot:scaffold8871_cov20-Tisochrysis_lutea.AAC.1